MIYVNNEYYSRNIFSYILHINIIYIYILIYQDRFSLYTIEQELSTEIKPIPSQIDRNLYCK